MSYQIFYSYQSDSPKELNEHFIGEAIDAAVKRIKAVEIEVIKGFSGTSGNKPLAATMFDQSKTSDLFIGDVTFTMAKEWHNYIKKGEDDKSIVIEIPKGNLKPAPNPNVLLETGYSWCHKDYDRTILVINTAFGNPKDLPADFGDLRWPLSYHLDITKNSDAVARSTEFDNLVNQLVAAIKAGLDTSRKYQREKFFPFKQYANWNRPDFSTEFILTDELSEILERLRRELLENSQPQRIIGPKISGRTRIAWQFLRRNKPILKRHEAIERIYYYPEGEEYASIARQILVLKELNQEHIIILDNCSYKTHKRLCEDLFGSNLKILTIGEVTNTEEDYSTIKISNEIIDSLISVIVQSKYSGEQALKLITKANGNVSKANSFITAELGDTDVDDENEIWKKLLGEYFENDEVNKVLAFLSLFSHIGYNDHFSHQADFVRKFSSGFTTTQFYSLIEKMSVKGIIRVVGDFIKMNLYCEKLYQTALEHLRQLKHFDYFIQLISENGLSRQFVDRLFEYQNSETAKFILKEISRDNGILFDFDFINSTGGSELVIGITELLPAAVLKGIQETVGKLEIDQLKSFEKGRRNVIWSLEYLVSTEEYFNDAARLLYQLALAENESISNNASGQFRRLFQAKLASTIAGLNQRMTFLKTIVEGTEALNDILLSALKSALITQGWIGFGIATRNIENKFDYKEPSEEELLEYWNEAIELLRKSNTSVSNKVLLDNFRSQFILGNKKAIWNAISEIFVAEGEIKQEWRSVLEMLLQDERVDSEDKKNISELIGKYVSDKTRDDLKYKVALAPYSVTMVDGKRIDNSQEEANQLAKDLFENDQFTWRDHIDVLLEGEQRKTFEFGSTCAALNPGNDEFVDLIAQNLSKIEASIQNSSLVLGYLSGTNDPNFTRETIDKFLAVEKIDFHTVQMTRLIKPTLSDLEKLYLVFERHPRLITDVQWINLSLLEDDDFISFINWILIKDSLEWWWSAIEICESYLRDKDGWSNEIVDLINSLLAKPGIVKGEGLHGWSSYFSFTELMRYISKYKIKDDLIVSICREIIELAEELSINNTSDITEILGILFRTNWEVAWPIISDGLLNEQIYLGFELQNILRDALLDIEDEKLLTWMHENPEAAPQKIIKFVDFEERNGDGKDFPPLVKQMLTHFCSNKEFLNTFSSRLHSYGISGSAVPINEQRMELMTKLLKGYPKEILEFAEQQIKYFERIIDQERRNDANWSLRF